MAKNKPNRLLNQSFQQSFRRRVSGVVPKKLIHCRANGQSPEATLKGIRPGAAFISQNLRQQLGVQAKHHSKFRRRLGESC
jgi:hypothetical protein